MTISLTHPFVSGKGDGVDTTVVQPSDWNDEHTLTMATAKVLGRATAGTGAVEELDCTASGRAILAATDASSFGFTAGDAKLTLKTTADTGWVMANDGTIGSATSGATTRANADTEDLFAVLWDISETYAPIYTSAGALSTRGANAAADFAANRRLSVLSILGRAIAVAGAGSGLTSRALGQPVGAETHQLTQAELPSATLTTTITDPGHTHATGANSINVTAGGDTYRNSGTAGTNVSTATTGITASTALGGSNTAHNNVQPTIFLNVMLKL
jgi:microcystin-dependent protein